MFIANADENRELVYFSIKNKCILEMDIKRYHTYMTVVALQQNIKN